MAAYILTDRKTIFTVLDHIISRLIPSSCASLAASANNIILFPVFDALHFITLNIVLLSFRACLHLFNHFS